jgi:deoxyribodipyrimidine photolyase-like uncharacterized protein
VVKAYEDGNAPLNAVEGFVRQIIGWREYVRGIYWLKMPDYAQENFFGAKRPLAQNSTGPARRTWPVWRLPSARRSGWPMPITFSG